MERTVRRVPFAAVLISLALAIPGCERRRVRRMPPEGEPPSVGARDAGNAVALDAGSDSGCLPAKQSAPIEISLDPITAADVLFVVDDSSTMADEQIQLAKEFGNLLATLTERGGTHTPRSLHLGVVSSDLGLGGVPGVAGCEGSGKAGVLQQAGANEGSCARALPSFLTFAPAPEGIDRVRDDLACMTRLGTDGCGVQQPLEAAFTALASDANVGFARVAPDQGRSVLAVVVISDKDDCSLELPERWIDGASFSASDDVQRAQQLNLRCAQRRDELFDLLRYERAFGTAVDPSQLVFAAITGIPRFTSAAERLLAADDPKARAAIFDELLADPRMQPQVDAHAADDGGDDTLVPVCQGNQGPAWPARRLVELAQRFGSNAFVGSICENDYRDVVDVVRERIGDRLLGPCLDGPLQRERDGLVACELIWHVPESGAPLGPSRCDDPRFPFLVPDDAPRGDTPFDPNRCRAVQLQVANRNGKPEVMPTEHDGVLFSEGWFYDDFSSDTTRQCAGFPRRIALAASARPDPAVRITLECERRAIDPSQPACRPRTGAEDR